MPNQNSIPRTPETEAQYRALRQQLNAKGVRHGKADNELAKLGFDPKVWNPHKSGGFSKVAGAVGDVGKKVAPLTAFIPGVGPVVAAGLTAATNAMGKLNDEGGLGGTKVFKDIIAPAGATYVGAKAMQGQGGFGKIAGGLGDGDGKFGFGDITSAAGKIFGGADGAFGIDDLIKVGTAGVGLYQGVKAGQQASSDSNRARNLVEQAIARSTEAANAQRAEFAANAPMRDAFRTAALNFSDSTNPFAKRGGLSQAASRAA